VVHTCPLLRPTARPVRGFFSTAISKFGDLNWRLFGVVVVGRRGGKSSWFKDFDLPRGDPFA